MSSQRWCVNRSAAGLPQASACPPAVQSCLYSGGTWASIAANVLRSPHNRRPKRFCRPRRRRPAAPVPYPSGREAPASAPPGTRARRNLRLSAAGVNCNRQAHQKIITDNDCFLSLSRSRFSGSPLPQLHILLRLRVFSPLPSSPPSCCKDEWACLTLDTVPAALGH